MVTDTYTGEVSPGGDPDVRRLGCLTLTKVAVDPEMSNNCYVLHCSDTDEVVLVDAAAEPERLLELIGDRTLTSVVTTHQHWDHHRGLAAVTAAHPGAVVVAGAPDADAIEEHVAVDEGAPRQVDVLGQRRLQVQPPRGNRPNRLDQGVGRGVLEDVARRVDHAVLAMRGVGIERDVGHNADVAAAGIADRLDRAAHQVFGIERLLAVVAAPLHRRVRKQREARNAERRGLLRPFGEPVARPARDAG